MEPARSPVVVTSRRHRPVRQAASKIPDSTIEHIRTLKDDAAGGGVRIALGGRMFQEPGGLGPAELIGILAAIVILLVAFGSLLAMGLPILVALFGIGIGLGARASCSATLIATPDFATAAGVDDRHRRGHRLRAVHRHALPAGARTTGSTPSTRSCAAIDTAGRAVVFAGCTVVISLLGLFLMGVELRERASAVGASVAVAVVMLASVTLLPGAARVRRSHDRPLRRCRAARNDAARRAAMWYRWSRVVQRRPWPARDRSAS